MAKSATRPTTKSAVKSTATPITKSATKPTPKSSTEIASAFRAHAQKVHKEFKTPGASYALILPDGDHVVNLGVTSLENPLPIDADTFFQIGSNTKTLTSLTISVLVAQGKLKLDDTVRTHLPKFTLKDKSVAAKITIRDLLTHQGGFQGDLFEETGDGDDAVAKVLDLLAKSPQVVPLRSHWSYNNAGFYVAGRIIEVITGQTYEAAVTESVLEPLGMTQTVFFANQVMTRRFSTGHNKIENKFVVQRPWMMMRSAGPAGSTCTSTITDMLRYAHYILSGTMPPAVKPKKGEKTKSKSPLGGLEREHLWNPQVAMGLSINGAPGTRGQMGQSWFNDTYPNATIISHGGTTLGQQSDFWLSPDHRVGFIGLTNGSNGHAMNRKLSDWVKREVLGLEIPEPVYVEVARDSLLEFSGKYPVIGQPLTIGIEFKKGALILAIPNTTTGATDRVPLRFIAPEVALITEGDNKGYGIEFLRNPRGKVAFIRFGGRLYPRGSDEKIPKP